MIINASGIFFRELLFSNVSFSFFFLVTSRNVCHLLNSIAPCSVREFKDAALEYVCLNLGDMLENR